LKRFTIESNSLSDAKEMILISPGPMLLRLSQTPTLPSYVFRLLPVRKHPNGRGLWPTGLLGHPIYVSNIPVI